jgi:hypothetical protein
MDQAARGGHPFRSRLVPAGAFCYMHPARFDAGCAGIPTFAVVAELVDALA